MKPKSILRVLPLVLVPVVFLAAIPWLKSTVGGPMVNLAAAATAIFLMGYATYISVRQQRGLDEVQRAGGQYAAQWGLQVGPIALVLLIMLPPFQDFATAIVSGLASEPGDVADRKVVMLAMTMGLCGVVLFQSIATVIVNVMWLSSKE
jgi:hypothetical protein